MTDPAVVLPLFGLNPKDYTVERIGSGHIHHTFKLTGPSAFVLQRVNKDVFTRPDIIASNLRHASAHLAATAPAYRFVMPLRSPSGNDMEYDGEGYPWRLFPYLDHTLTVDSVQDARQAFEAASAFARLTRYLDGADASLFRATIPRFHDLILRKQQFEEALAGSGDRALEAQAEVAACQSYYPLVDRYAALVAGKSLKLRVVHNDTKINNVLFDQRTGKTVAVIDLDTLMPGYFIYDLGDMVRTFVCPVSEEERDLSAIQFRRQVYDAVVEGYLLEMGPVLSEGERKAIPFAGKMMTYIMALRFLADFLRGNTYYHITYPDQNRVRAANQLQLLNVLSENLPED